MTEQPDADVPEFDLADRMRKSLRHAGLSVQDMADYLGVSRKSVGNWIGGRVDPSVQTMRLWALRCGVDYRWLRSGELPAMAGNRRSGGSNMADNSILCTPMRRGEAGLAA